MADEEAKEAQSDDNASAGQSSITVIEILDSSNELVEKTRQNVAMEEKSFIAGLHSHMRARGTPIERIPHLGFKQINLWMMFKAVEKLGGYDSVTTKRLWKKIYDELGGSPGSTSAATCTRKHYERLVLPYERYIMGEEEKPLPPTKPRKPYKRSADGKGDKAEIKTTKSQRDSQLRMQRHDLVRHPLSSMWTVDKLDHSKHSSESILPHVLPVSKTQTWTPPVPPGAGVGAGAGAGISPLEKKKRVAQASLSLQQSLQHSPQRGESQRNSVILCSSPGPHASARASSDGSPQPQSSSSSRSPSPLSVSSEDSSVNHKDKTSPKLDLQLNSSSFKRVKTEKRSQESKEIAAERTVGNSQLVTHYANHLEMDRITNWMPNRRTHFTPIFNSSPSFATKHNLAPVSTSSFTKIVPKMVQLMKPAPIRLSNKIHQTWQVQGDSMTKNSTSQRTNHIERWENSLSRVYKDPLPQQNLVHSLPRSCLVSSYNKPTRDSRPHTSLPSVFLPNRMRTYPQLMYKQVPVTPGHPAIIGPVLYPFSYPISHPGLSNVLPVYPHKHE